MNRPSIDPEDFANVEASATPGRWDVQLWPADHGGPFTIDSHRSKDAADAQAGAVRAIFATWVRALDGRTTEDTEEEHMTINELAWKGRLIITMDGHVDLPPDRQGIHGPTDADARRKFIDLLNDAMPQGVLFDLVKEKIRSREIRTREHNEVVLFDGDHEGTHWLITGNSNASHGYFYAEARIVANPTIPR